MSDLIHSMEMECSICGQPAHGFHFGVLSCRPCIEFYRRSVLKRKEYNCLRMGNCSLFKNGLVRKCKACRFEQCRKAGMHFGQSAGSENENAAESSSSEKILEISNDLSLLWMLKNSFERFLILQNAAHSMRNSNPNIFGKAENLRNFEQATKPMIVRMFEKCVEIFAQMDLEEKFELVGKCLAQINFLAACQRTLKHFPSANDGRFFVAHGLVLDMAKFKERGSHMDAEDHFSNEKLVQRRFHIVQQFKNLPYPIQKVDISVLAAMLLIGKSEGNYAWDLYKEAILGEWHQHQKAVLGDADIASLQIGRLLSLLAQLDMMILKESTELTAILPAEFRSNRFNQQSEPGEHFISHFSRLLKCHKRIWTHFYAFNDQYLQKFEQFQDLLADSSENILTISDSFATDLIEQNSNLYVGGATVETVPDNFWGLLFKDSYVMTLTTLGLLKAMPVFKKIGIQDRMFVARHLCGAMENFIKSFYSAQLGAQTWMRPEGLTSLWVLKMASKQFAEDERLFQIADKCFTHPVQRFHNLQPMLTKEEFALLLAILASNTSISGLSHYAQEQLYAHQNIYSRMLFQHLQKNLGMEAGAKRFADCLFLMEGAFIAHQNGDTLRVYIDAFHGPRHELNSMDYPKCLQEMM